MNLVSKFLNGHINNFYQEGEPGAPPAGAGVPPAGAPPAGAGAPPAEPASLVDSIQDAELKTWAEGKGWTNPEAVVKSAFNLEKMVGAPSDEIVRLPANADDDTVRGVLTKLGLPEKAEGYQFNIPDGTRVDEGYINWAKETFHEVGLPQSLADKLVTKNNEYVAQVLEQQAADYETNFAIEENNLKAKWGSGYERQLSLASNAAQTLGFDKDVIDAVEKSVGYQKTMELFNGLGTKLGEDNFVGEQIEKQGFHGQMTPVEAKTAYANMLTDPNVKAALVDKNNPAHKEALNKKAALFKLAYPE